MRIIQLNQEEIEDPATKVRYWKIVSEYEFWINPESVTMIAPDTTFPDYSNVFIGGNRLLVKISYSEMIQKLEENRLAGSMKRHLED